MYEVINYIFNEDISLGSPFEISFQSFFEGAQKAGDAIQELNNLVVTILLAALNSLPSQEYLWNVLQRLAIFIPYVIYSQYKQYKLEKRIYELTWTLSYQLRKDMFKVVTPQSNTSFRRSSSCIIKQTEFSSPMSTVSTSSAPGRPRRRSVLPMGDTAPVDTRMYKNKSSPVLFRGKENSRSPIVNLLKIAPHEQYNDTTTIQANEFSASHGFQANSQNCVSWKTEDIDKDLENKCLVPMNPTKKLKRDTDDNRSTTASGYSTSIVRRIFKTPQVSLHHTFTVCCNVLSKKDTTKSQSGISQDLSTSTSHTKQYMGSIDSKMSCEQRKSRIGDCESKWRRIIERNKNIKNERLAKMKEAELQKLQEQEKTRKAEMMRRRVMIARIREQNKKLLMEQRGMKMDDIEDCNNEIALPVIRVKPVGSISNQVAVFQEHGPTPSVGDLAGQVPVLRVMQRTVTIERTAKISKFDNEREYNMMETKALHMGDVDTKLADDMMLRNAVKEKPGQRIPKNAEYYLLSKGTPPNKQLLYVKMSQNSGVTPSDTSFANKSRSEIYPRPIRKYGDVRQVRSNLQKISEISNSSFQCSSVIQCEDLNQNINFSSSDSPGSIVPGSMNTNAMISRPFCQVRGTDDLEKFTSAETNEGSDHEDANGDKDVSGGEMIENVISPTGDGMDTKCPKPVTPPRRYDVEAPPSPTAFFDSKNRRPVIKRARRRLQKELDKSVCTGNQTLQQETSVAGDSVSPNTAQIKGSVQQSENLSKPKPKDAKVTGPKSLLLKKIELRKQLEERVRAITCRNPPIRHPTSAVTETKGNEGQSLKSQSESTKNSNERPAPVNKPRRFSLDVNASRTKLGQSRALPSTNRFKKCLSRKISPTITTMKKGSLKCLMYQQGQVDSVYDDKEPEGQEKPKASTPRANLNRTTIAANNRRKTCTSVVRPDVVHSTIDGTHCRNKLGSPVNRRLYKENSVPQPDPSENAPDVAHDQKIASPVKINVTKSQESDSNFTQPSDDNFPSFLASAGGNVESPPPEESKTEMKQLDESCIVMKTDSGTTDSSKNKRSDFLAFQMDEAGHPVPVNHSKASSEDRSRSYNSQRAYPCKHQEKRRSSVEQGYMRSSSVLKKPTRTSSKRCLKNEEPIKSQGTVDEKEWNERMKTWEKKRKQLVSSQKSSQGLLMKSVSRHRVNYKNTMETANRHCENREIETKDTTASLEDNSTNGVNSIISSKECREVNENGGTQGNNKDTDKEHTGMEEEERKITNESLEIQEEFRQIKEDNREFLVERKNIKEENGATIKETASGYVKNEYLNEKNGSDKEEMARIHSSPCASSPCASSLVQATRLGSTNLPIKLGSQKERRGSQVTSRSKKSGNSRRSDSVGLANNSKRSSSHGEEDNNPEMTSYSPKGGWLSENPEYSKSVLSPIQSISDNNYNSDSATESNGQLKTLNIKQPNGDYDNIKSAKSYPNQVGNSPVKTELKEEEGSVKNELQESCLNSSVSSKLEPKEQTEYSENTGLAQLESGTQKIHDTYRIDYPQDSEKENEAQLKSSSQVRRETALSSGLAFISEANFRKGEREERKSDDKLKVVGEARRKSTSTCRKSKDISVILDDLLTVTKALKEEHISREFRKNHSKPRVCDNLNDRTALSAIICCPEGSSIDDLGSLPAMPVFLHPPFTQKRIMNPVVVEFVVSSPAEFNEKARETNDRFLKNGQDDGGLATRIEWYEDLHKPPISSEELDTHQDVEVQSYKEIVVDRRGCKSKNEGVCTAGYERRNYKVRRYEVHHDASNCYINNSKKRSKELSPY